MIALSFSQVNKAFDEHVILKDASFSINTGDKLGLIGKNGTGKTTLLRLITGDEKANTGMVYFDQSLSIGYMRQTDSVDDISLIDYCTQAFADLIALEGKLKQMEVDMGTFKTHDEQFEAFMHGYDLLARDFEHRGGYLYRSKARGILIGLGFTEEEHGRKTSSLSGGQLAKLKLARLLIDEPDILLLDEPTNHLDIKTTAWLEGFLKQYTKTLIIVSHDRYFLDAVCSKIMEIEHYQLTIFDGNYSDFVAKKAAMLKQRAKAYDKYIKEKNRQEEIIRRFKGHGTEKLVKRAQSREKRLAQLAAPEAVSLSSKKMKLQLSTGVNSGYEVLRLSDVCKSYDDFKVLVNIAFDIFKGDKIGLIGANGSGKSTLLKIIGGMLDFDSGAIDYGHHVQIAYYDQAQEDLCETRTIVEEIHQMIPQSDEGDIRTLLGRFLFTNDEVFKLISVLSGGERARVMLTKLFLTDANLLILDEPTNHLDIYSKEVLEQALCDYDGTMIVVSHDRYFLNKVCDQIIEIEAAQATRYHGGYDYYLEKKNALTQRADDDANQKTKTKIKNDKKRLRQAINQRKALKQSFEQTEAAIYTIETRLGEIDHALCQIEIYSDPVQLKKLTNEQRQLNESLDNAMVQWTTLSEQIEELNQRIE